jgi:hypothetical protein
VTGMLSTFFNCAFKNSVTGKILTVSAELFFEGKVVFAE